MLIGNERIQRYLDEVMRRKRPAHAYLFYGPTGVGKTTFAEALAKGILCEEKKLEGCGRCAACRSFEHSPNIIRMIPGTPFIPEEDGEDISLKEVQELRRMLGLSLPSRVVLIEEAGRMAREAANAFLKILEEPLPGTVFLLTAEIRNELLPTIRSRLITLGMAEVPAREMKIVPGATPERLLLSQGRPGRLIRMIGDPTYEVLLQEMSQDAKRVVEGLRGTALSVAGRYAERHGSDFVSYLFNTISNELPKCQEARHVPRRIGSALTTLRAIETTNVNRRLAWDILMLNSRLRP